MVQIYRRFQTEILHYAKANDNTTTAWKFDCGESSLRLWKKEEKLNQPPS